VALVRPGRVGATPPAACFPPPPAPSPPPPPPKKKKLGQAVYEETRAFDAAGRKARVLGGLVSPAQPEYVYGLVGSSPAGSGAGAASESLASSRARPLLGESVARLVVGFVSSGRPGVARRRRWLFPIAPVTRSSKRLTHPAPGCPHDLVLPPALKHTQKHERKTQHKAPRSTRAAARSSGWTSSAWRLPPPRRQENPLPRPSCSPC